MKDRDDKQRDKEKRSVDYQAKRQRVQAERAERGDAAVNKLHGKYAPVAEVEKRLCSTSRQENVCKDDLAALCSKFNIVLPTDAQKTKKDDLIAALLPCQRFIAAITIPESTTEESATESGDVDHSDVQTERDCTPMMGIECDTVRYDSTMAGDGRSAASCQDLGTGEEAPPYTSPVLVPVRRSGRQRVPSVRLLNSGIRK